MTYPDAAMDLLRAPGVAMLSTKTPEGAIQTTAVWYFLDDDGELKLSLSGNRRKLRNLQADPTVTVFLLDPTNQFHFVEVRGTASIAVDQGYAFRAKVGAKYGSDLSTFDPPGEPRYVVTIVPTKVNAQ